MSVDLKTGKPFPRGAKPTPPHKLLAARPFVSFVAPPPQFAVVPSKLSVWMNDQYGVCVSSEEAFAKACWSLLCGLPETFVPDDEVYRFARQHGWLDGATLTEVMDVMKGADGLAVDGTKYHDGNYTGVDYSNESVLQSALATGPVKIAIDAGALPSGAGNHQGWYAVGGGRYGNTDHCVGLCGYGPAEWLYQQLGVPLPSGLAGKSGYLLFTWSTIGFVDHAWLMGTCTEAWVRTPTTPEQKPAPTPPPGPDPVPPTPTPPPAPLVSRGVVTVPGGTYGTWPFRATIPAQTIPVVVTASAAGAVGLSIGLTVSWLRFARDCAALAFAAVRKDVPGAIAAALVVAADLGLSFTRPPRAKAAAAIDWLAVLSAAASLAADVARKDWARAGDDLRAVLSELGF